MPSHSAQLWPCVAMAALTGVVLIHLAWVRLAASLSGRVRPSYFAYGDAHGVPARIVLANAIT